MKCIVLFAINIAFIFAVTTAQDCNNGYESYGWGISDEGKKIIIQEINKYRQLVLDGDVPNQPQGKNINMVSYDDVLGDKARVVSEQCDMKHIIAEDPRWSWVGQNIYQAWSSVKCTEQDQDWAGAAKYWYDEYKNFKYPDISTNGEAIGHYTQLIWHDTEKVGCDYVCFYDEAESKSEYPYSGMYTCNFGPGGNWQGEAPYELA